MGVRATCTHITSESNDTIRVDLIGQAYGGVSREVIGNGRNWMRFSHDQLDYANVFNTSVQRGRLEFSFMVQSDDDRSVVTDVLATAQGEYTMAYYRNGTLQWIGEVMMDQLGSLSVGEPYPYAVTLVARDFVPLEGQLFPLEDNRQLATTVLGRLLSATGYDLPIWTHTSWVTSGTNSSNDFLRQVYVDTRNLREFNKEGDIQITYLEALTRMVAPFKAVLRQVGGVFVLDQLSAYETPSSVLRTIYDKDGAFQSQSNVNTTVSANASVTVVRGSIDEIKPGYKRAAITYNHRTPQSNIFFLPRIAITEANPNDVDSEQFIESGKVLTLTGSAGVGYSTPLASTFRPQARIQIEVNGYYWNANELKWQTDAYESYFIMSGNVLSDPITGEIAQDTFTTAINITTAPTPVQGTLKVTLKKAFNPTGATSQTVYLDMDFIVAEDEEQRSATATRYVTEQSLSFTQNYDGGNYYFGDGPTQRSPSALRKSTTVTDLTTSWTRRGGSDDWEFHEIALKEIMDHYRGYGRVGSYIIKQGNYTPLNVLAFETRALYYVGGQFDGFTGWWSPILFQLDLVTGFDQLVVGYVSGPSLITSTTLTAVSLATNNSIEANANYVFRLAEQASGTVTQLIVEPMNSDYPLLRTDTNIRVVHPVTLEQYTFTLSQDMFAGSLVIQVVSVEITNPLPKGSYIYTNAGDGTAALIIGRDSIRLIAESTAVGVTTSESLGSVTSIAVRLNTRVQAGDDLFLVRTLDAVKRAFTVGQTVGPGVVTLQLDQPTVFDAPAGSYIIGSNAQYEAFLQVTPAGVLAKAEAVTTQNSFAILSAPLSTGTYTSIPVTSVRTLKLKDGSVIGVQDKAGNTEFFTVDGDQDLTPATTTISVESETTSTAVGAGAGVFQPSWNQTGILSVQADQIALRVTSGEVQTLINESIAGVLPAVVFNFDNTTEGFTTNSVTLTAAPTVVEYLATGSTPYIQKALDTSYAAADNPVVTIRVKRIAGTNWGGAFGWSTDGTNFNTQTFTEPTNLDSELSFTTIDLTSNVNYTGTITHIRIYLGEANLDEFEIDQFTIGKFNPQTEILEDLSTRLTVAEGAITVESDRIDLFTQKSQELNRIAEVTGTYNQSSTYTSIALTNIRSGFDIRDNQVLYLVNVDGTFQSVVANGTQNPLASPLAIDSVTFSTTISAGAMLYEASFTQSSRITQSAGQIVLKAEETDGEVTSLALVRLDGTGPSSSVTIQGDLVAINDIQITRGTGANPGVIQTSGFISGSSGWRIKGDGNAEFNDVTVRGEVIASSGSITGTLTVTGALTGSSGSTAYTIDSNGIRIGQASNLLSILSRDNINFQTDADPTQPEAQFGSTGIFMYATASDTVAKFEVDTSGNIYARGDLRIYDSDESNYINLAFIASATNRTATFPDATGTVALLELSQTFTADQGFSANATFQNGIILVGDGANGTVSYAGNDTRTFTIPDVGGNRTFAFIDQAQTFSVAQTFTGDVIVPNSTTSNHALNVTTADGRYARLGSANTFSSAQTINANLNMGSSGTNRSIVFATQDGGSSDITVALTAENGGTSGNKTVTIPNATGTLVTTAAYNQDIAGTKHFTGILRAQQYRASDNSVGQGWSVRLIDSDNNQYDVVFTNGLLTSVTAV